MVQLDATGVLDHLDDVAPDGEHPLTFRRLRDGIARLPPSRAKDALTTLTNHVEGELTSARVIVFPSGSVIGSSRSPRTSK